MRRLSIEEWMKRDNPFKIKAEIREGKKAKVIAKKQYLKKQKANKTPKVKFKKIKPIRDIGVIEAAQELARILSYK